MSLLRVLTLGTIVFYSQRQNWHRLPNGLFHLPAYPFRLIRVFGEDQNHHVALANAVDDRFPSLGPWSDITWGIQHWTWRRSNRRQAFFAQLAFSVE